MQFTITSFNDALHGTVNSPTRHKSITSHWSLLPDTVLPPPTKPETFFGNTARCMPSQAAWQQVEDTNCCLMLPLIRWGVHRWKLYNSDASNTCWIKYGMRAGTMEWGPGLFSRPTSVPLRLQQKKKYAGCESKAVALAAWPWTASSLCSPQSLVTTVNTTLQYYKYIHQVRTLPL